MRSRTWTGSLSLAIALSLASVIVAPRIASGQVGVTPSIAYYNPRPADSSQLHLFRAQLVGAPAIGERRVLTDFVQGTTITGAFGKTSQADVSTRAIRVGVYGKAACADTTCVKHLWFSFDIDSHIVDAFGASAAALKQYVLSDRGSPLTLSLPTNLPLLTFSTATPSTTVPESYVAGQLIGSARLIPVRLGGGSLVNNGSFSVGYSFESHFAFSINDRDGSAFAVLTPSYSYIVGDSLQLALSSTTQPRSSVGGLSYRVGYQFGSGTAVSASGNYSFTSIRDGRRQLSLALNQALGAIGGGQ